MNSEKTRELFRKKYAFLMSVFKKSEVSKLPIVNVL